MKAKLIFATALVASLSFVGGCDFSGTKLRMMVADYGQFAPEQLQAVIEERSNITFELAEVPATRSPLDALVANEADLALVENNIDFVRGVRVILPVYKSVLHIAMRDSYEPIDLERTLKGADFYVANRSAAGASFVKLVTHRDGLEPSDYQVSSEFQPEITDIIIYFGPINPTNTNWFRDEFSLVSLDDKLNPRRKFYEEGIGYNAPGMKPIKIPALTYELPGNEDALLTVSVDALLVTRKDISESAIYKLTKTFIEQKPRLAAIAPHLFSGINESFDPLDLSFPLHPGARSYLQRDDPGFLERYAETINMLVYVTFLLISAFLGFARWRERMKKDRVDVFYERVMEVRDDMKDSSAELRLGALNRIEREAFDSLISEKLAANESFRIFTDLLATTRGEITKGGS